MKPIFYLTMFAFLFATGSYAQADLESRIQQERVAFFNRELQLTDSEAEQFWPLYDQYRADEKALKKSYNLDRKIELLTDEEVDRLVFKAFELEEKQLNLKRKYVERLKPVLPIRKIALLRRTEQKFKRGLLNKIKNHRQQRRKQGMQGRKNN